jgi:PAS domain S-box-containing protein
MHENTMDPVRILIADDHEIVRRGIRSLFSLRSDWEICGEAVDGQDAVDKARQLKPDVVLLDVSMPALNGLEAARVIRREVPQARIMMVSQHDASHIRRQALEAGAREYVAKTDLSRELLAAVEAAVHGNGGTPPVTGQSPEPSTAVEPGPSTPTNVECLAGGGEMGALMRSLDWSKTQLGPVAQWPQSLKTSVSICLNSRFAIVIWWGPELLMLYNDAYRQIIASKHPAALGNPGRECWREIWPTIAPMLESVMTHGEATWSDDLLLLLERHGYAEECYFTFSYSPIRDESGGVAGVFTPVKETTEKVIGERRLRTLRDLAARAMAVQNEQDTWRAAAETLAENLWDIPFSILGQPAPSGDAFRIVAAAGIEARHPLCLALCRPGSDVFESARSAEASGKPLVIENLSALHSDLPCGAWDVPPRNAVVMPIATPGQDQPSGILLAAVNPRKVLDDSYHGFFDLVTRQIASAIADARSYEQERKRAEALAEVDRAKTAFFSNVSHEFRTPLTLLLGPLEEALTQHKDDLPEDIRSDLSIAHRSGLRLLKLVNTLLDFSRMEAGRLQAVYEPTDLSKLTESLASMFRSAMEKAGLTFRVDCEPSQEPAYVDRAMWEKIVFNLLSNAFKYTLAGEIEVSLRQREHTVELAVRDTGVGIPADELSRVFERFHRVSRVAGRSHEGTGIGLALVHDLVRLHGGGVGVESEPGRGSTFTVSIPRGSSHLPQDQIKSSAIPAESSRQANSYLEELLRWLPGQTALKGSGMAAGPLAKTAPDTPVTPVRSQEGHQPLVLLADDNADMRDYVARLLGPYYEVHCVGNGKQALAAIRTLRPDLVLTDVMMPSMDGFQLLRAIREDPSTRSMPVILLSARAGEEAEVEGLEAGADDYLIKPFSARELLARVSTHVTMAKLRRRLDVASAESTRLFRLVADTAAVLIWVAGTDGKVQWVNRAWLDFTGRTMEEEAGYGWLDSVHPEERQHCLDDYRSALQARESFKMEYRFKHIDGSYHWILAHGIPRYSEGTFAGYVGSCVDITDRKATELEQARFVAIVESSDDAIISKGLDGTIHSWNRGAERVFGYTAAEAVGKPITLIIPPELHGEEREILARLRRGERIEHFETIRVTKDGRRLNISLTVSPIRNSAGQVVGASKIARDITERKQSEAMLKRLYDELETRVRERTAELERAQDDLRELSTRLLQMQDEERRRIARELHDTAGQILAALSMNLMPLEDKLKKLDSDMSVPVTESLQLVDELSKDLRTISHLLHPPLLDEAGLASALQWLVQGYVERSKIPVTLELAPNLGRLSSDLETTIFRVVQECLTNVHRHSGSPRASIGIKRESGTIRVEIRDWGKGMPHSPTGKGRPGVGVQGMKERVRQLGGRFEIQSGSSGTAVTAILPEESVSAHQAT